jgi:hypothetical protein
VFVTSSSITPNARWCDKLGQAERGMCQLALLAVGKPINSLHP